MKQDTIKSEKIAVEEKEIKQGFAEVTAMEVEIS